MNYIELIIILTIMAFIYVAFYRRNKYAMLLLFTLVGLIVLCMVDNFHFEVTPWKTTCLNDAGHRCPQCCLPGYNGKPINFEYTGDAARMNAQVAGCAMRDPSTLLKNNPRDYAQLDTIYNNKENFTNKYLFQDQTGVGMNTHEMDFDKERIEPIVEGFEGGCGCG